MFASKKKITEENEIKKSTKNAEISASSSLDLSTMELSLNIGGVSLTYDSDQWRPESTDLLDAATTLHTILDVRLISEN